MKERNVLMNCSPCKGNTEVTFETADHQCVDCGRLFTVTRGGVVEWPFGTKVASLQGIMDMMANDGVEGHSQH